MFLARLLPPIPPNTSALFLRLFLLSLPLSLRQFSAALPPPPPPSSLPASPSVLQPRLPAHVVPRIRSRLASSALSFLPGGAASFSAGDRCRIDWVVVVIVTAVFKTCFCTTIRGLKNVCIIVSNSSSIGRSSSSSGGRLATGWSCQPSPKIQNCPVFLTCLDLKCIFDANYVLAV